MALSVKRKIQLGTWFLLILLVVTGGAGVFITATLKNETQVVLKDNYLSVDYCHTMQQQLDIVDKEHIHAFNVFDSALKLQEQNITEPGEDEATRALRTDFNLLRSGDSSVQNIINLHSDIQRVIFLNMRAIRNKDINAQRIASNAVNIIIALAAIVFLISFSFSYNFPAMLINPINELNAGIREITNKNYQHRIHLDNKDEFGYLAAAFNNMAERLEFFENSSLNKLMFEKSRAEAVINSLKDASIGIDKDNIVLFANFQALELLGLKQAEVIGKSVAEVGAKNDLFRFLVTNESTAPFKIVVSNRENYFIRESMEVTQGDSKSKVIVLRNITSFKELDVAKTNFIATISHELKTPLAASDFSLKLLEDKRVGELNKEQKELLDNLKQDHQRILKIISELLNMSQVETGKLELNINAVPVADIVDNAINTVSTSAKDRNILIKKDIDTSIQKVLADADKSTWVLNNFLTNAIKYSPEGCVINVNVRKANENIVFAVADQGQGIPPEYIGRLFEKYFQVPGSKIKGTGLGLAISKEFIEAQKGRIWVESETGKGSTFSFSLPVG